MKKVQWLAAVVAILCGVYIFKSHNSETVATVPFQHPKDVKNEQSDEEAPVPAAYPYVNRERLKELESKPYNGPAYKVNYRQERMAQKAAAPAESRLPASKTDSDEEQDKE